MLDEHRVVRYRGINIASVERAAVLELGVVVHGATHPMSFWCVGRLPTQCLLNIGDARQIDIGTHRELRQDRMTVAVDEARRHGQARRIDDARLRSNQVLDIRIRADGEDVVALDRHRLGARHSGIHRQQVAALDHDIGMHSVGLCVGYAGTRRSGRAVVPWLRSATVFVESILPSLFSVSSRGCRARMIT